MLDTNKIYCLAHAQASQRAVTKIIHYTPKHATADPLPLEFPLENCHPS